MFKRKLRVPSTLFDEYCVGYAEEITFNYKNVDVKLTIHQFRQDRKYFKSTLSIDTELEHFELIFNEDLLYEQLYNFLLFVFNKVWDVNFELYTNDFIGSKRIKNIVDELKNVTNKKLEDVSVLEGKK